VPVSSFGLAAYEKYGAPRVAQARTFSEKEYDRRVRPLLDDLNSKIGEQYHARLGPHLHRATSAVSPYVDQARKTTSDQYDRLLVPAYEKSLPYAQSAYVNGQHYVTVYGIPYGRYAFETSTSFITRRVWPPIRVLYGRNVEPQLAKIKERLASYRDSKRLEAAVDAIDSSSASSVAGTPIAYSTVTGYDTQTSTAFPIASTVPSSKAPEPLDVAEELKRWQAKFAKAADQGAEDLSRRVSDIVSDHMHHQVEGVGAALVTELDEASTASQSDLQSSILSTISSLPEDADEASQNNAYSIIRVTIRTHGNTIKDKAQSLRLWKLNSNEELTALLDQASSSTLSVLDSIRDLGLQEIGMRWSTSDHITYEDWTQYHKLKQSFHDWREKVAEVITSHKGVAEARQAAEELEDKGMGIAQSAAEELARLKDVARWKIHTQDTSDDFSSRKLPAAAARLGQKIMSKASSAGSAVTASSSSQNMAESIISAATSSAASAASQVSESLSEARESAASKASDVSEDATESTWDMWEAASSLTSSSSAAIARSSASILSAMASAASSLSTSAPQSSGAADRASLSLSSGASSLSSSGSSLINTSASPPPSSASASLSSAAASAASAARSITSAVSASSGSFSNAATIAAGSAASKASSRASKAAEVGVDAEELNAPARDRFADLVNKKARAAAGGDVIDAARSSSESIKSQVSEAGEAYETVTQTLRERASVVAEEGRGTL